MLAQIRLSLFPHASKHNCPLNIHSLQIFVWHPFFRILTLSKYPSVCVTLVQPSVWKIFRLYTLAMTIQFKYCGMINPVL